MNRYRYKLVLKTCYTIKQWDLQRLKDWLSQKAGNRTNGINHGTVYGLIIWSCKGVSSSSFNMDEPESTNSNMNIIKAEDVDDPPSPIPPLIVLISSNSMINRMVIQLQ